MDPQDCNPQCTSYAPSSIQAEESQMDPQDCNPQCTSEDDAISRAPPGQPETASSQSTQSTPCWECQARLEQQQFLQLYGDHDYDSFKRRLPSLCHLLLDGVCKCHLSSDSGFYGNDSELTFLKRKIGYALYGEPKEEPSIENDFTGYEKNYVKEIMKIFKQVIKGQEPNRVLMALVYVSLKGHEKKGGPMRYPVFRIPSRENYEDYWFVDHIGRLYKGWADFTCKNKLPGSKCCYPRNGIYSADSDGDVELCFDITPASSIGGKVLNALDISSSVVSVGSCLTLLYPPAALAGMVAGAGVGVYSIVRGSIELVDRGKHYQSLRDREAFRHWLSLAASSLGMGSAGGQVAVKWMGQTGRDLPKIIERIVNGITSSAMLVNGVGIAEGVYSLVEQRQFNKMQCFQLTASIMFFLHSAVNFKTARSIYMDTQNQILQTHRAGLRSKRHQRLFDGLERETLKGESDQLVGRAKIIRDINYISNKDEFYAQILRSNKSARKNSLPIEKVKFGVSQNENGGQPPSQKISTNLTVGNTNPAAFSAEIVPTPACDQMQVNLTPELLLDVMQTLQRVAKSIDLIDLLAILDKVCSRFSCGKYFMRAVRIVIDFTKCKSMHDAEIIIAEIVQIAKDIYADRMAEERSSAQVDADESQGKDSSKAQSNLAELGKGQSNEEIMNEIVEDAGFIPQSSEEIMNEIVEDAGFIPQSSEEIMNEIVEDAGFIPILLSECEGQVPDETVYHFPSDHRQWGEYGELTPEEYILIGQNALGISEMNSANLIPNRDTTSIYFERAGFVTVTSYVQEQKVVVKTINFQKSLDY